MFLQIEITVRSAPEVVNGISGDLALGDGNE
jgi:hypothetical protein